MWMKFYYYVRSSPTNWGTMINGNKVPTIFQNDHVTQGLGKSCRTAFQNIIVIQLGEEVIQDRKILG